MSKYYSIIDFQENLSSKDDVAYELFSRNGMSFQLFHIKPQTCIQVTHKDESFDSKIYAIIVLDGEVDALLPDRRIVLEKGHILSHENLNPIYLRGRTFSNILIATNEEDQQIETYMTDVMQHINEMEAKDLYLKGHNARVANYSSMIIQRYNPNHNATNLYIAALLHDVGKVSIDANILNKPGKLTDDEFLEIKKHPIYSYDMISEIVKNKEIAEIARWHHEKLDGSGYPDNLKSDEIPCESKVISVADIFDALTTSRSYRKGFSFSEALEIMQKDADLGKIDSDIFEALKQLIDEGYIIEGHDDKIHDDQLW